VQAATRRVRAIPTALYPWRRLVGSGCRLTKRAGPSGATTLQPRLKCQGRTCAPTGALILFQREAVQGTDVRLKRFASNALPTLRERLQMAQAAARMGE
jgi:hypothetical protein